MIQTNITSLKNWPSETSDFEILSGVILQHIQNYIENKMDFFFFYFVFFILSHFCQGEIFLIHQDLRKIFCLEPFGVHPVTSGVTKSIADKKKKKSVCELKIKPTRVLQQNRKRTVNCSVVRFL